MTLSSSSGVRVHARGTGIQGVPFKSTHANISQPSDDIEEYFTPPLEANNLPLSESL